MIRLFTFICVVIITSGLAYGQQRVSITGVVTDEQQQPLIGANVYINGTTIGTATDAYGNFKLNNIKVGDYQLCASYSGYKRYRLNVALQSDKKDLTIQMIQSEGNLGEVVVTGTGTPHHLKTAPVPTELISSKMIEDVAAPDFISLMQSVSPSFDFTPGTMGSFIQLNGLGNDFIVILIDGRRVYGDMGGMNDLGRIIPNNVERIEVVKGASSSLYGSDAIGGVINIITKKSNRGFSVRNNTQYSSYNTLQQTNNIDFNFDKLSGSTTFSLNQTDGWQNSAYELDDWNDDGTYTVVETDAMTQNAYVNRNIRQDLSYNINENLSINGGISYYINDYMRPVTVSNYGFYFEDLSYNIGAKYLFSKKSHLSFDYNSDRYKYYYKYNQTDEDGDFRLGDLTLNNDQQRRDYNLRWVSRIGSNQTLSVGSELVQEIYRSETRILNGKVDVNTLSFYAQDELTLFEDLMLTAGVRVVKHDNFGTIATPKVSALYKLNNFNFRGTYSRGFKAPTLKEQYYHYVMRSTMYLGNTDLDPQTSDYYTLGVDYHNNWLSASVSAYQNDVKGLITYRDVDTLPEDADNGVKRRRQHYNVEEARTKGVDVMFDAKLPAGFSVGGGYSYVDAKNLTDDIRLEYVAQNYGNVRAGYLHKWENYDLNLLLTGRFQDERFFDDTEGNAKGYNLWNFTTTHTFADVSGTKLTATLGIDNIFDYVDDLPDGFNRSTITPGRTFKVGVNIVFAK
nr:TonB-dependent receptor [uncultured Carboxylicivirga sp.]